MTSPRNSNYSDFHGRVRAAVDRRYGWRFLRGFFVLKTPWFRVRLTVWRRFDDR